jgi:hypothetical protein
MTEIGLLKLMRGCWYERSGYVSSSAGSMADSWPSALPAEKLNILAPVGDDRGLLLGVTNMRNLHQYMGGSCLNCGQSLGYIEVDGGRTRRYCNDACRKAASRERSKRDNVVSRNEHLVSLWDENCLSKDLRHRLVTVLVKYGKEAAMAATEAVVAAIKEVDGSYMSRSNYSRGPAQELERLREAHCDLMYKHSQLRTAKELLERRVTRLEQGSAR